MIYERKEGYYLATGDALLGPWHTRQEAEREEAARLPRYVRNDKGPGPTSDRAPLRKRGIDDLVEACLKAFYGDKPGWGLLRQTWPEVAVEERRRMMREVILVAQAPMRDVLEGLIDIILEVGHGCDEGSD